MWYQGTIVTRLSSDVNSTTLRNASMLEVMLRWQSMTPLASSVVPDVYMRTARSSQSGCASGTATSRSGRTSHRDTAPRATSTEITSFRDGTTWVRGVNSW